MPIKAETAIRPSLVALPDKFARFHGNDPSEDRGANLKARKAFPAMKTKKKSAVQKNKISFVLNIVR
jgi:hypothetical protein